MTNDGSNPTGTEGVTVIPRGGYQSDQVGVPSSTLFRNTRFPNGSPITLPAVEPSARTESVKAGVSLHLPTLSANLPFLQRSFEPRDADLKLGPFFFKLTAIQGAVLHSDNINQTPDDQRESGTIAIASATVNIIAQLTEGLHIATSATLIYLPLEGEVGLAGFQFADLYSLGLFAGPTTRAQVAWDTQIGGWNVVFVDEFMVGLGTYSNDYRSDNELFDNGRFDGESRAGRYSFRAPGGGGGSSSHNQHRQGDFRTDYVVYSNEISADTQRLLPGSVRLHARVYHEDLWYNQGNRGLPGLREGAYVVLASERANTRFKPFVSYEAFRSNQDLGYQSIFRVGIAGPITEQLFLHAEAGYYFGGGTGSGELWKVTLDHTPSPYTRHSLIYTRTFDDFHQEIDEGIGYNFHQILGPKLNADLYIYDLDVQNQGDSGADSFSRHELRTGVRFTLAAGPKTAIRLSGTYSAEDPTETKFWTGRLEIGYDFTETLHGRIAYQYRRESSGIETDNFSENLFFLSLTKYFQ